MNNMKKQTTTPAMPNASASGTTPQPPKTGKKKTTAQEERLKEEKDQAQQPAAQNAPAGQPRVNEDEQKKTVNQPSTTSDITPEETDSI
jgi:hypothetical protein